MAEYHTSSKKSEHEINEKDVRTLGQKIGVTAHNNSSLASSIDPLLVTADDKKEVGGLTSGNKKSSKVGDFKVVKEIRDTEELMACVSNKNNPIEVLGRVKTGVEGAKGIKGHYLL